MDTDTTIAIGVAALVAIGDESNEQEGAGIVPEGDIHSTIDDLSLDISPNTGE